MIYYRFLHLNKKFIMAEIEIASQKKQKDCQKK